MASLLLSAPTSMLASSSVSFFARSLPGASSSSASSSSLHLNLVIVCGRGDKRTAKGKRTRGSFGNCRPKDSSKGTGLDVTPMPPRPKKKDDEDTEYIHVDIDESLFAS